MLAAVLKDFDQLVLEEVAAPEPGPGEVVVRIKSCGFCATDYKAIKGIRRNVMFPLIPGHEPSGVVAKVGTGVDHFREGDEVIVILEEDGVKIMTPREAVSRAQRLVRSYNRSGRKLSRELVNERRRESTGE